VSLIPNEMKGKPLKATQSMATFFTICMALGLVGSVTGQGNSTAIASRLHNLGSPIELCDVAGEGSNAFISCGDGIIDNIVFASYGTPTGNCETGFAIGNCHSETSLNIVQQACIGKYSCTVLGSYTVFGDPCAGTIKWLGILVACSNVADVTFAVAAVDRVAGKAGVDATFTFTPSIGSYFRPCEVVGEGSDAFISCGKGIIDNIVFASYGTPIGNCSTGFANSTCNSETSLNIVQQACIGKYSCTVFGSYTVFGDPCAGINKWLGIIVTCSNVTKPSVTLNYPSGFFATSATPTAKGSAAGATLTPAQPGATSIALTVGGSAPLAAGTAVTVTLVGCTMGPARAASDSITVQTDADTTPSSPPVSCGRIGGAVTNVTFNVQLADRVQAKAGVEATFTFTPSAGGDSPSSVTLNYPSGFFATSATPTAKVSTAGATLTPAQPGATSIALTVGGSAPLAAGTAVTVTLVGCTMGLPTAGGGVNVSSSADPTLSNSIDSYYIGGAVADVSFAIPDVSRKASRENVTVSFRFTPTAGGRLDSSDSSRITLAYPVGFFAPDVTPAVNMSGKAEAVSGPSSSSSIVITLGSGSIVAGAPVYVTLSGMTIGADGTEGGPVTLTTSRDVLPSSTASGTLNCSSLSGSYCPNIHAAKQPCLAGFYCPFPDMPQGFECEFGAYCVVGQSNYTNCPKGTYRPEPGAAKLDDCHVCEPGYYCGPTDGQKNPTPCPGGTFNNNNGSWSSEECVSCPLGKFCPAGSAVGTDCPAGTYNDKPDIGAESGCVSCPKGYRCSPPEGSITPCACKVFEFQPNVGQPSCEPCPLTASLSFGATSCLSEAATSSSSLLVYYYLMVALFASIAVIASVLTARLVRSRHTSPMRFVRFGMCLYVAMFVPYAVLQAISLGKFATLNNDRSGLGRDTVRITSSAAFAAFFGLGFSGKVALVQRWTYVVRLHTSGSHASPLGLQNTLRSTYKTFVWAIVVIVVFYLMGFSTLTNRFMDSVGRCAKLQDASCVSVTRGVEDLQQPCSETLAWTNALQYYEGVWAAVVLVVFTFLAFLFNGVVFAM
jgi:hypothetical protein